MTFSNACVLAAFIMGTRNSALKNKRVENGASVKPANNEARKAPNFWIATSTSKKAALAHTIVLLQYARKKSKGIFNRIFFATAGEGLKMVLLRNASRISLLLSSNPGANISG